MFDVVKALAHGNHEALMETIEERDSAGVPWTRERINILIAPYFSEHARIRLDPGARGTQHTRIREKHGNNPRCWGCEQTLVDPEELNDWALIFTLDLDACDALSKPALVLENIEPLV